jgi:hypothetical protein
MCVVTDSTNIQAVGYSKERKLLRVQFRDGSLYDLSGVTAGAYTKLMSATSIGVQFAAELRGKYDTRCLRRARSLAHRS